MAGDASLMLQCGHVYWILMLGTCAGDEAVFAGWVQLQYSDALCHDHKLHGTVLVCIKIHPSYKFSSNTQAVTCLLFKSFSKAILINIGLKLSKLPAVLP